MTRFRSTVGVIDQLRGWRAGRMGLQLLGLCLILAACGAREDSWQRVAQAGLLRVGVDPSYPPFAFVAADGTLQGVDVDLARALGEALGVEVSFTYYGYDGLYDALLVGQVDGLISALVVDVQRTRDFAYSQPYFNLGQMALAQRDAPGAADWRLPADLAGRRVAVELGAAGHVVATDWQRQVAGLTIQTYPSAGEAVAAVAAGQTEVALSDAVSGRLALLNETGLMVVEADVTVEPLALVVRREDESLLRQLDAALAELRRSGAWHEILSWYMAVEAVP